MQFYIRLGDLSEALSVLDFALQSYGGTRRETARRLFVFQGFGGSGRTDWMSTVLLVLFWGWPIARVRRVRRVRLMGMGERTGLCLGWVRDWEGFSFTLIYGIFTWALESLLMEMKAAWSFGCRIAWLMVPDRKPGPAGSCLRPLHKIAPRYVPKGQHRRFLQLSVS